MAAVKSRHSGVTIHREPINSDPAAEVPRDQWKELLAARREFCERKLPHDCRLLLFFVQDGAANDWLGLGSRERYIEEGLKLQPQMVEWALKGLEATRPDVAVEFADAVVAGLRANGGDRRSEEFQLQQHGGDRKSDQSGNTRLKPIGKRHDAEYIRARLERDGHAELLAKIEHGETSAHAVAVELGWRTRMIQAAPTVEGFARAIRKHLIGPEILALKELL